MKRLKSHEAYETIKAEILECVLEPGQQIAQAQLAERFDLGMTPIREALQRLSLEGLVQITPRVGYVVTPITLSELHDMFEVRMILECAAARLAAVRGTAQQLEELLRLADFSYSVQDRNTYLECSSRNVAFHKFIAQASGNQRLAVDVSRLLDELARVFHIGLDLWDDAEAVRDRHLLLAMELRAGDPDRAEQIVQHDIAHAKQAILEALTRGRPYERFAALGQAGGVQV